MCELTKPLVSPSPWTLKYHSVLANLGETLKNRLQAAVLTGARPHIVQLIMNEQFELCSLMATKLIGRPGVSTERERGILQGYLTEVLKETVADRILDDFQIYCDNKVNTPARAEQGYTIALVHLSFPRMVGMLRLWFTNAPVDFLRSEALIEW